MYLFFLIAGYLIATFLGAVLFVRIFPRSFCSQIIDRYVLLFPLFPLFVFIDVMSLSARALAIAANWPVYAFDILTGRPRRRSRKKAYTYYYRYRRSSDKRRRGD
ncbi:hypothetical protein K3175_11720 [Qipengyuania sp. GH1]|uniref:hypothetical protein n=1 Tax=Qipengyuania aestuarii TaxID=2867241 RepID=UPI001C87B380|nr:hypothetical protein [Qipengyuania aestuarii]MBX7536324.1 hypothetical protein [Qipengyuania aestuarii]